MGCANSMPLLNGSGGMVDAAKTAVSDTMHAGEEALHDVGESLNEAAVSVKDAVIGAVKSIGNGVDDVANDVEHKIDEKLKPTKEEHAMENDASAETLYKTIPLKDATSNILDENFDDFKDMLSKMAQDDSVNPDTNNTLKNVAEDLEKHVKTNGLDSVHELIETEMSDNTPSHSIDSLKTTTPEPEIIKAMLNDAPKSAPSPKPTLKEMKSIEEMDEVLNKEML